MSKQILTINGFTHSRQCFQRIAYIVDPDYFTLLIMNRVVACDVRFAEDIDNTVKCLALADLLNGWPAGIENGSDCAGAVRTFYIGGYPNELVVTFDKQGRSTSHDVHYLIDDSEI